MKKVFALLLMCAMLVCGTVSVSAAEETFVPSVEQSQDVNAKPDTDKKAPQTGDSISVAPIAGAVVFAVAAAGLFVIAVKKKKED